jgi:hypothetical protein
MTVRYPSSMRYDDSVGDCPADICELFADLFESVYNVDSCDSDTKDMSGPSGGCGFSGIRLRMSDLEAAISGLDANKGPGNDGVPPSFVKLCADGLKSPLLHIFNSSLSTSKWKDSFLIPIFKTGKRNDVGNCRGVQHFHALRNCSRAQYMIIFFFRSNFLLCQL